MKRSAATAIDTQAPWDNSRIRKVSGMLFILAILEDEDDAASLRTDLNRSGLVDYKLQHCASLDEGINLMKACGFDLAILNLDELDDGEQAIQRIRETGYVQPLIALASQRVLRDSERETPSEIERVIKKEDMTPSLVEHMIRSTMERHSMAQNRERLREQLHLALDAGKLGSWAYRSAENALECDAISSTMFGLPAQPGIHSLDEILKRIYPEDRQSIRSVFADVAAEFSCEFRLDGETMPLTRIALQGRFRQSEDDSEALLLGVAKQLSHTDDLFERIVEANTAIEEALGAREAALKTANSKLQALADELGLEPARKMGDILESSRELEASGAEEPAKTPEAADAETAPIVDEESVIVAEADIEETPAATAEIEEPQESPKEESATIIAEALAPEAEDSEDKAALAIDKKTAFQEVLRSMSRQKPEDQPIEQQSFPFDFSSEPATDFSLPDPSKEGFNSAAKRLIAMTRKGHGLEVSFSNSDQQAIEMEIERELLFAVLRELLTNVVKHAKATLCIISLFRDEDEWVLQVEDDGIGLEDTLKSVSAPLNQIGLFRTRTQLALKGGHLDMAPASPSGLVARARLPVKLASRSGS